MDVRRINDRVMFLAIVFNVVIVVCVYAPQSEKLLEDEDFFY